MRRQLLQSLDFLHSRSAVKMHSRMLDELLIQLRVFSIQRNELPMRAPLDDPPLINDQNLIRA